ncbi:MAG: prepilin-type N-terminal cleavage/methylation domain-containing protein [Planctomycetota bacterium]|nr:prepilin-type N-terminal cleavage/methylation domain-containing protein [Planctomycetota bacterium]
MIFKPPKEAEKPKVRTMGWIGLLLFIVGVAKLGDALLLSNSPSESYTQGLILSSTGILGLGAFLMLLNWVLKKRPPAQSRSLADIREKAKHEKAKSESGFTLMEVIVTLALVALLFSMVAGVLISVLNVSEQVADNGDGEKIGYGVLGLVQRDIQGCVAYGLGQVVFKGEDKNLGGGDADEIYFITTTPGDAAESEGDEDGTSSSNPAISSSPNGNTDEEGNEARRRPKKPVYRKVSYVLRESPDADRGNGEERYILCRRSIKLTKEDRDVTSGQAPYVEVVDGLKSFKVEYKESPEAEWVNGWEDPSKVPVAVRFTIEVAPPFKLVRAAQQSGEQVPQARRFVTVASIFARGHIPEPEEETANGGN